MPDQPRAVDIRAALADLPVLRNRRPDTPPAEAAAAFATLANTANGGVFAGSFVGESAWERHPNGDELVQILDGATTLSVIGPDGTAVLQMTAGMVTVVPRGRWHKFTAPAGVTVLTMTPTPTDHSQADQPG